MSVEILLEALKDLPNLFRSTEICRTRKTEGGCGACEISGSLRCCRSRAAQLNLRVCELAL